MRNAVSPITFGLRCRPSFPNQAGRSTPGTFRRYPALRRSRPRSPIRGLKTMASEFTPVNLQSQGSRLSWGRFLLTIQAEPERTWTISQVAKFLGLANPDVRVRMGLSKYAKAGKLRRIETGLYQSPATFVRPEFPSPNIRFHGLKCETVYKGGEVFPHCVPNGNHG